MNVCAIILSYKRPANIQLIINEILLEPRITKIIVSNNNPDINLSEYITTNITLLQQNEHTLYTKRLEIAAAEEYEYFFCPDDDIFLTSKQIGFLLDELLKDPTSIHGVTGQQEIAHRLQSNIWCNKGQCSQVVQILNRAYFFTKNHAKNAVKRCFLLGFKSLQDAKHLDDVLLSSNTRCLIHFIGDIAECNTSHLLGIATYKETGFEQTRWEAYKKLHGK